MSFGYNECSDMNACCMADMSYGTASAPSSIISLITDTALAVSICILPLIIGLARRINNIYIPGQRVCSV